MLGDWLGPGPFDVKVGQLDSWICLICSSTSFFFIQGPKEVVSHLVILNMAIGCPTASHSLNVVSRIPEGSYDLPFEREDEIWTNHPKQ